MNFKLVLNSLIMVAATSSVLAMERPPAARPNTWTAAQTGDLESLRYWIQKGKFDIPSQGGLTPLMMVVSASRDKIPSDETYLDAIKLLVDAGANIRTTDPAGLTLLHKAAQRGYLPAVAYLIGKGAKSLINVQAGPEQRTPLAEALRAHKGGLIWLDIAFQDLNQEEFKRALPRALADLSIKEARKPSTVDIYPLLNYLHSQGARTDITDKAGRTPLYYINHMLLVNEPDRALLTLALGEEKVAPITREYSMVNLPDAIAELRALAAKQPAVAPKINMVIWAIQAAQQESREIAAFNILRIAMAILAKVNEALGSDAQTARVRAILHDAAIQLKEQAQEMPSLPAVPAPIPVATKPAAAKAPVAQPAAPPLAAPAPAAKQQGRALRIGRITNYSPDVITFEIDNKYDASRFEQHDIKPGQYLTYQRNVYPEYDQITFLTGPMGKKQRTEWRLRLRDNQIVLEENFIAKKSQPYKAGGAVDVVINDEHDLMLVGWQP